MIGVRDEVLAVLEPLTDEQWHLTTAAERWPVGDAARHIAKGFRQVVRWVEAGCGPARNTPTPAKT